MAANLKPFKIHGPGDLIKEELENKQWVQEDLAYVLDISLKHLNEVINNKKSITLELSVLLGKVFNKNYQYWLNAELEYRKQLEENESIKEESVEQKTAIADKFPINEMFKKKWLQKTNDVNNLIQQVKSFLDNKKELSFAEFDSICLPDFSKSTAFKEFNSNSAKAWFYMARNSSRKFSVPKYNKKALEQLYSKLHTYTIKEDGIALFLKALNSTGVKFIFLSHLQKTYLNGAAFSDSKFPVIVYTGRHNRIDNFWYVMAHEIAHILYHVDLNKDSSYFINIENAIDNREDEANQIAGQALLEGEILDYFRSNINYITEDRIRSFSKEKEIHPAVIVGILAHNSIVSYVNLHKFNEPIREQIPEEYMIEKLSS